MSDITTIPSPVVSNQSFVATYTNPSFTPVPNTTYYWVNNDTNAIFYSYNSLSKLQLGSFPLYSYTFNFFLDPTGLLFVPVFFAQISNVPISVYTSNINSTNNFILFSDLSASTSNPLLACNDITQDDSGNSYLVGGSYPQPVISISPPTLAPYPLIKLDTTGKSTIIAQLNYACMGIVFNPFDSCLYITTLNSGQVWVYKDESLTSFVSLPTTDQCYGILADTDGTLYVAQNNSSTTGSGLIWKITPSMEVSVLCKFANTELRYMTFDGNHEYIYLTADPCYVFKIEKSTGVCGDPPYITTSLNNPRGISYWNGNLYIMNTGLNMNMISVNTTSIQCQGTLEDTTTFTIKNPVSNDVIDDNVVINVV